jgi:hypothetical protein
LEPVGEGGHLTTTVFALIAKRGRLECPWAIASRNRPGICTVIPDPSGPVVERFEGTVAVADVGTDRLT